MFHFSWSSWASQHTKPPASHKRLRATLQAICQIWGFGCVHLTINVILHEWTPWAVYPSGHHIYLDVSTWTSGQCLCSSPEQYSFHAPGICVFITFIMALSWKSKMKHVGKYDVRTHILGDIAYGVHLCNNILIVEKGTSNSKWYIWTPNSISRGPWGSPGEL